MSNGFFLPIDKTLSGATTPGQSGPGNDGNEGVLRIPQTSSISGLHSSKHQNYCSLNIRLFNAISRTLDGEWGLPLYRDAVGVFYSTNRLGWLLWSFFTWNLSNNKSRHVSRSLFCILADLSNAEIWMVSHLPFIVYSSRLFSKHLESQTNASTIIGITAPFMFNWFFNSLAKLMFLVLFSFSLIISLGSLRTAKSTGKPFFLVN